MSDQIDRFIEKKLLNLLSLDDKHESITSLVGDLKSRVIENYQQNIPILDEIDVVDVDKRWENINLICNQYDQTFGRFSQNLEPDQKYDAEYEYCRFLVDYHKSLKI